MHEFLETLGRRLSELEELHSPSGYAVAFSGGLDSTVLLAGCARLERRVPVRALHVDHGLHASSAQWAHHCGRAARALSVEFQSRRVHIDPESRHSLEAEARERRYEALGEMLHADEMLLTAHHEDDQLETVLMRLLRGAGVKGLRGILADGRFANGYIGRPLLGISKAEIEAAAAAWRLEWIEDTSNRDQRFDRNYLRHEILPLIKRRWPQAARTVGRTARQMADAEILLEQLAAADAVHVSDYSRVPLAILRPLDSRRQANLLRYLLAAERLPLPTAAQLGELMAALRLERRDAQVRVQWPGALARVHGDHLYLMAEVLPRPRAASPAKLRPGQPWSGPEGRLELIETDIEPGGAALPDAWVREGLSVRFRAGGERLKPAGSAHRRKLKTLLQEAGVVPWMRSRIPLLYRQEQLVAVGDLWICDAARDELAGGRAWKVRWSDHPALY